MRQRRVTITETITLSVAAFAGVVVVVVPSGAVVAPGAVVPPTVCVGPGAVVTVVETVRLLPLTQISTAAGHLILPIHPEGASTTPAEPSDGHLSHSVPT